MHLSCPAAHGAQPPPCDPEENRVRQRDSDAPVRGLRLVPGEAWFSATSFREATCLFPNLTMPLTCLNLTLSTTSPGLGRPLRALFRQTKLTDCNCVQAQATLRAAQGWGAPLRKLAAPEEKSSHSFPGPGSQASPGRAERSHRTVLKKNSGFSFPFGFADPQLFFSKIVLPGFLKYFHLSFFTTFIPTRVLRIN